MGAIKGKRTNYMVFKAVLFFFLICHSITLQSKEDNSDYTIIVMLIDRSGSMRPIADDVTGGFSEFIDTQQQHPGRATCHVAQFDHQYEIIYNMADLHDVDPIKMSQEYHPRGATALLDAIGRTTDELAIKIEEMPEEEKPKHVIVCIITDGRENSSYRYSHNQIKELVKSHQENLNWEFVFLGATIDAIEVAGQMGISAGRSASYNVGQFKNCVNVLSEAVMRARLGQETNFTQQERDVLNQN